MKQSGKIRVAVLYGGRSAEHEVSLRSAANVIENLDSSRFEVIPIGIDKKGRWFLGHDTFQRSLQQQNVTKHLESHPTWFAPEWLVNRSDKPSLHELTPISASGPLFDVVFPVVHGTFCEDGTLQGLLETADLPYVGCGVLASSIGMDKDVAKRLALLAGIHTAPYVAIKTDDWQNKSAYFSAFVAEKLTYPVFVKPANTGSSIGITKVSAPDQLAAAVNEAFRFDTKILIEKALNIMELEVAVLESLSSTSEPIVSVVGEIKPRHEFYSYEAKYLDQHGADLLIPADISPEQQEQVREVARKLFLALECEGMARVDLFLNKDDHEIYFNEVNTIPGFTQISMYPKLMAASGMSYSALLTHLIELAMNRHHHKSRLLRDYVE
jgi:D-alanine-D-alanine ligase